MGADYMPCSANLDCDECSDTITINGEELATGYAFSSGIDHADARREGWRWEDDEVLCPECVKAEEADKTLDREWAAGFGETFPRYPNLVE